MAANKYQYVGGPRCGWDQETGKIPPKKIVLSEAHHTGAYYLSSYEDGRHYYQWREAAWKGHEQDGMAA